MTNPGTTLEPGNIVLIPSKKSWIRTDKLFTLSSEIVVKNFGAIRPDASPQSGFFSLLLAVLISSGHWTLLLRTSH
jgi:hypothetical protein